MILRLRRIGSMYHGITAVEAFIPNVFFMFQCMLAYLWMEHASSVSVSFMFHKNFINEVSQFSCQFSLSVFRVKEPKLFVKQLLCGLGKVLLPIARSMLWMLNHH